MVILSKDAGVVNIFWGNSPKSFCANAKNPPFPEDFSFRGLYVPTQIPVVSQISFAEL